MTRWGMLARTLRYYRATGLCAALGLAVAAAVITGSLVIGDSVRGSIRDTALGRLGAIDLALQSPRLFRAQLTADLALQSPGLPTAQLIAGLEPQGTAAALLLASGSVTRQEDQQTVPRVSVIGAPPELWPQLELTPPPVAGDRVALNAALAADLGLKVGDLVLVNVGRSSALPGDSLFARRSREDSLTSLAVEVAAVLPQGGGGDFRLDPQTAIPRNVFVDRDWLAEQLGQPGKANAIVVERSPGKQTPVAAAAALTATLNSKATLEDHGLQLRMDATLGKLDLSSEAMTLSQAQLKAATNAAEGLKQPWNLSSVYLATRIKVVGSSPGKQEIAYAMLASAPFPRFQQVAGPPRPGPDECDLWLNDWAAQDLGAKVGDSLEVTYLVPSDTGSYPEAHFRLPLKGIVKISGSAADRHLLPDVPGITDAASIDSWKTPFPVDMKRVTPRDETYWQRYGATPKVFTTGEVPGSMWTKGGLHDYVTGFHVQARPGQDLTALRDRFAAELGKQLAMVDPLPSFRPVRQEALDASRGTSDFSQLFLGLSMFIVASGLALSAMLLRLALDRRASEVGLLLAVGWTARQVRRLLVAEGMLLAALGTVVGVPAGVLYAQLLIAALTSSWSGALGMTARLWLHLTPASLAGGLVSGLALGVGVSLWSTRALVRREVLELLAGWHAMSVLPRSRAHMKGLWVMLGGILKAASLVLGAIFIAEAPPTVAFFGAGVYLLVAGLAGVKWWLGHQLNRPRTAHSLPALAVRNAAAQSGRSLLVVGLLASAAFVLVAVATNARDLSRLDPTRKDSGTGGFTLRAVAAVPLPYDPSTPTGRQKLGFSPEDEAALKGVEIMPFLASPGEDISCLNLAKPSQPRLLGVPERMVQRGGFTVKTREKPAPENPWTVLASGANGAFGDASSVQWTLHSGLGKTYSLQTPGGETSLEFTGLLQGSIFQGELLTSAEAFKRLYPTITRPPYFLLAASPEREQQVAEVLRRNLGDYGVEVRTTRELLQSFIGVQNAYLAMFLALGGVGLLLGTVGLAIVILRSALERRGQLALLTAVGYTPGRLARLLLLENVGLLLGGLAGGAVAGLVAVLPQLRSASAAVNWPALTGVLSGILLVGLAACAGAVRTVVRGQLLEALREE